MCVLLLRYAGHKSSAVAGGGAEGERQAGVARRERPGGRRCCRRADVADGSGAGREEVLQRTAAERWWRQRAAAAERPASSSACFLSYSVAGALHLATGSSLPTSRATSPAPPSPPVQATSPARPSSPLSSPLSQVLPLHHEPCSRDRAPSWLTCSQRWRRQRTAAAAAAVDGGTGGARPRGEQRPEDCFYCLIWEAASLLGNHMYGEIFALYEQTPTELALLRSPPSVVKPTGLKMKEATDSSVKKPLFQDLAPQVVASEMSQVVAAETPQVGAVLSDDPMEQLAASSTTTTEVGDVLSGDPVEQLAGSSTTTIEDPGEPLPAATTEKRNRQLSAKGTASNNNKKRKS